MKYPRDKKELAVTYEQVTNALPEEMQRRLDGAFDVLFKRVVAVNRISKLKNKNAKTKTGNIVVEAVSGRLTNTNC